MLCGELVTASSSTANDGQHLSDRFAITISFLTVVDLLRLLEIFMLLLLRCGLPSGRCSSPFLTANMQCARTSDVGMNSTVPQARKIGSNKRTLAMQTHSSHPPNSTDFVCAYATCRLTWTIFRCDGRGVFKMYH